MKWKFKIKERVIFQSTDSDNDEKRECLPGVILARLNGSEADLHDVGPMYRLGLDNGGVVEAFQDELAVERLATKP